MKKFFVALWVSVSFFGICIVAENTVSAAPNRGYGLVCNSDDLNYFPYGYMCGTHPSNTPPQLISISAKKSNGDPINDGTNVTRGQQITVEVKFNDYGGGTPKGKNSEQSNILAWSTIDGDETISNGFASNISHGGNGSLRCPGAGNSGPGPVYGFRDMRQRTGHPSEIYAGPEINGDYEQGTTATQVNGVNQSPLAYNPANNTGKVDCGAHGRMVYWQNANAGTTYSYRFKLSGTDGGDRPCIRFNVSARFSSDVKVFPDSNPSPTPHQQNVWASHLIKQSPEICFNVTVPPTTQTYTGDMNSDCSNLSGYVSPAGSHAIQIQRWNGSAWQNFTSPFTTNSNGTFSVPIDGAYYYGNGTDNAFQIVGLIVGTIPEPGSGGFILGGNLNCHDDPVFMSMSTTCTQARVYDASDGDPDGSQNMHARIHVYHRNSDGTRGNFIKSMSVVLNPQGYHTEHTFDIGKTVPEVNHNQGIYVEAEIQNITTAGTWGDWARTPDASVGPCYTATCELSISGNIPGGSAGQVQAGSTFTVSPTIRNTGDSDNAPLYDDLGGNQLTITDGGGDVDFSPYDFSWGDASIGLGQTAGPGNPAPMTITAPSNIGTYRIVAYADYYGRFAIGGSPYQSSTAVEYCEVTFKTFKPYYLEPSTSIVDTNPDDENPNYIKYAYSFTRKSPGESTNIPEFPGILPAVEWYGTSDSYGGGNIQSNDNVAELRYINQGVQDNPTFHSRVWSQTFRDPGLVAENDWTDTIPDVRQFSRGSPASTDTWKIGDKYEAYFKLANQRGWMGPDGFILSRDKETKAEDIVENHPFVRTYGDDVSAGGNFPGMISADGKIQGFTRGDAAPAGSGTEFAAMALGMVDGFTTASLRTSSPISPNGLLFANKGSLKGEFGGSIPVRDWFGTTLLTNETPKEENINAASVDGFPTDKQRYIAPSSGGRVNLSGKSDYEGRRTLYIEGDVTINSDIVYKQSGRANLNSLPAFALIVKGNIYISKDVKQLDGFYVAQPKDAASVATSGKIYTCAAPGGTVYNSASARYDHCYAPFIAGVTSEVAGTNPPADNAQPLRVNGSFVAQEVVLGRAISTLSNVKLTNPSTAEQYRHENFNDTNAAEAFRMTPEFYLGRPPMKPANNKYDYIISLPPVL